MSFIIIVKETEATFWAQARGDRFQAKCAPIWGSVCEKKSSENYAYEVTLGTARYFGTG